MMKGNSMKLILSYGEIADVEIEGEFDFDSAIAHVEMLENIGAEEIEGADVILSDGTNEWFLDSDATGKEFWSKLEL
jgi:hypothetical protein